MLNTKKLLIGIVAYSCFFTISLSLYAYETLRPLPENTYLGDVDLGGFNRYEAVVPIQSVIDQAAATKILVQLAPENEKVFLPKDLGIVFNPELTLEEIFQDTGLFASLFGTPAQAEASSKRFYQPVAEIDQELLRGELSKTVLSPEKDFIDAHLVWDQQNWRIEEAKEGVLLKSGELDRLTKAVTAGLFPAQKDIVLVPAYEPVAPRKRSTELQAVLEEVNRLVGKNIVVSAEKEKTEINLREKKDWIAVDAITDTAKLDEVFARGWISEYAKKYDTSAGSVTITAVNEVISEYDGKPVKKAVYEGDFARGRSVQQDKLLADLLSALQDPESQRKIAVEWDFHAPTVSSNVEGYQFPQQLSTGVSSYRYGNHPNRVKNIKLSLESFQGIVIAPGEEFSFNRATGWITPRKGYTKTQIIEEGRVKDGFGGGVCQSSSTVYRAVLNAGLPVIERRNHSLDIVYYHEYGYGLDATVYTDSRSDLRFVNDFPGPILVNIYTDDFRALAHVEFYGTTDHRVVQLTNIPTGDYLLKKWDWKIIWPDREEQRTVLSRYQLPKEDEPADNPLEG